MTCADYKGDGMQFVTGAADTVVRLYDESTRQLVTEFRGGGTGPAGHNSKVMCCKFVDENLILTGGWDRQIKVWDIREPAPIRSIFGPYVSADSLDVQDGVILAGSNMATQQLAMYSFDDGKLFDYISWDDNNLVSSAPCKVYAAQFMKQTGEYVVAGGSGCNEVKIFDSVNGFQPVAQIKELSRAVFSLDFSNNNDMFAMGGGDGVVRVFNLIHDV
jgi:COMPASS component SWD3